ncbi:hypothetical protein FGLOB1_5210 [Fusarium globosum]|uniref:Heterokaryon incompatibility domain-containing protein n=1 Tax=Fusarium globosum TaxID=78864 RepID=A0A8H5YG69_9HYPO|nr:hypothetical protein FGLOB1_5210 [Fusarium globosum]
MPVCGPCHDAICDIYPKVEAIYPERETTVTYPSFDPGAGGKCWICIKHAGFLEHHYPAVYERWLKHELLVTVQADFASLEQEAQPRTRHSSSDETLPFDSRGRQNMEVRQLIIFRNHGGDEKSGCLVELKFYKQGAAEVPQTRLHVEDCTSNLINIPQIQDWIGNCRQLHTACCSSLSVDWYPTRLLDLAGDEDRINVVLTQEERPTGPYMTLSHRWSDYKYEKLTSQSLSRFRPSIDTSCLPRVFQQAIEVTRSLQIRYLWIDSLCIMQDIACGDWEAEALKMGDVYANSFLNLSASYTAGEDENPSIFSPESWNHVLPSELVLKNDKELRSNLFIDGDLWNDEVGESPLMERGWVFQERFLAPRVLHFGMRQLAWECNGGGALQMFPTGLPPRFEDNYKKDVCWPIMRPMNTLSSEEFCSRWHDIVTAYSACHLTFNTDKLIAFAGIAKIIQSSGSDEYIAGTWKSTIIADLAWWVYKANGRLPSGHQAAHRAPSWSWLSSDRQICFHPYPSAHHKQEYFCRVMETPAREAAGVSVLSANGILELQGLILPVDSLEWHNMEVKSFKIGNFQFNSCGGPESTNLDYDGSRADIMSLESQQQLFVLPLYATGRLMVGILISNLYTYPGWRRVGGVSIQYQNIPPELHAPALDGWIRIPDSRWEIHIDGYKLYYEISTAFQGDKVTSIKLV